MTLIELMVVFVAFFLALLLGSWLQKFIGWWTFIPASVLWLRERSAKNAR